jgi:hypothetical protein
VPRDVGPFDPKGVGWSAYFAPRRTSSRRAIVRPPVTAATPLATGLPSVDVIRVLSAQFHDSEVTEEALEDLRDQLESAGLDATVGDPEEPRRVRLRKSLEPGPAVDVLLLVLEDVREGLVGAAVVAVLAWAKRRRP